MQTSQELQHTPNASDASQVRVRPIVDLVENENDYTMYVEMPGVDPASVDVSVEKNVLSIVGTANFGAPEGSQLVCGDAGPRRYERSFQLSEDIDRQQIDAEVKNGLLTLTFSKSQHAKKTAIPVRSA